jgi:hypothetical protein
MIYSQKRYWLAIAVAITVAVAASVLLAWLHPTRAGFEVIAMGPVAVCFALGLIAYFSRDEIQRQNRMRAWYWGGTLAIVFILVPFILISSNTMLTMMVPFLPHLGRAHETVSHAPKVYFAMGVMVTLLTQAVGYYVARIALCFRV